MIDPMVLDLDAMVADLTVDEGLRLFVYDDANGKPIVPGSKVIGHPTIGVGLALDVRGLTGPEAKYLLLDIVGPLIVDCAAKIPFWAKLNGVRKRVVAEMAFNMGIDGVLKFANTLAAMDRCDWAGASAGMLASHWADQVGDRAKRLAKHMLDGA
jgi:lysozyme